MKKVFPSFIGFRDLSWAENILENIEGGADETEEFFRGFNYLCSLHVLDTPDLVLLADAGGALSGRPGRDDRPAFLRMLYRIFRGAAGPLPEEHRKTVHPPDVKSASIAVLEDALLDGRGTDAIIELEKLLVLADDSRGIFEKLLELAAMDPGRIAVVESLFMMYTDTEYMLRDHYLIQACRYLAGAAVEFVPPAAEEPDFTDLFRSRGSACRPLKYLQRAAGNAGLRAPRIRRIITHSVSLLDDSFSRCGGNKSPLLTMQQIDSELRSMIQNGNGDLQRLIDLDIHRFINDHHPVLAAERSLG